VERSGEKWNKVVYNTQNKTGGGKPC